MISLPLKILVVLVLMIAAFKAGENSGKLVTEARINSVLRNQMHKKHLGGTWDAMAVEFNGEP